MSDNCRDMGDTKAEARSPSGDRALGILGRGSIPQAPRVTMYTSAAVGPPFGSGSLPTRVEPNTIVSPFHESDALDSLATVLIGASRWIGADQPAVSVTRDAVQMSGSALRPPTRVESNTTSSPSFRTFGRVSSFAVFSPGASWAAPRSTLK